jgi:hypothetical protein
VFDFDLKAGGILSCHWRGSVDLVARSAGFEMHYLPASALRAVMPFCLMCQAGNMWHRTRLLLLRLAHGLWGTSLVKLRWFLDERRGSRCRSSRGEAEKEHREALVVNIFVSQNIKLNTGSKICKVYDLLPAVFCSASSIKQIKTCH